MSEEKQAEAFLDRWSRRKREQAQVAPAPSAPPTPAAADAQPAAPLPPVESLKPESDFTPFMAREVAPETRRAALKQLFTDAHFNTPDPFEPYSIDFTISETIPEEMLKSLNQVKSVLFDEKQRAADAKAQAEAQAQAQAAAQPQHEPQVNTTEPTDVAGKQDA